jgi:thymidylate kinase
MYIGGMGGTGKTTVIDTLKTWFKERGESGCMIVLAPTGAAASVIGGSTYHSYLGIRTNDAGITVNPTDQKLDEARKHLTGI